MSSSNSPTLALELPVTHRGLATLLGLLGTMSLLLILMNLELIHGSLHSGLILLLITIISCVVWQYQVGYGHSKRRLQAITWQQQGEWLLHFADGSTSTAQLAVTSWIMPWLWCLRFSAPTQHVPVVMLWRNQLPAALWQLWSTRLYLQGRQRIGAEQRLG